MRLTNGLADADGDGLVAWREYELGTDPDDPDSDNDQLSDGLEEASGTDPAHDDSAVIQQVQNQGETFGLYTSNAVLDLAVGQMALETVGSNAMLRLQLEQSDDLQSWTNAGDAVEWSLPVGDEKKFFRVRSGK